MAEYDLVCDACGEALVPEDGVVAWAADASGERGFALTHTAHVAPAATSRRELRDILSPNGYLRFVSERLGRRVADPEPLRAILWGIAPFVMRHDNATEMDLMRAASFGARLGVKPGDKPAPAGGHEKEHEGGK